jgi:hypothetical protein
VEETGGPVNNHQLAAQSVPITTKVVSSNPIHGRVYSIQHNVIKFVSLWNYPIFEQQEATKDK